jgi:polar amino acid transport system permease protein
MADNAKKSAAGPVPQASPAVVINVTDGALIPDSHEKTIFSAWNIAFFGAIILLVLLPVLNLAPVRAWFINVGYSIAQPLSGIVPGIKAGDPAQDKVLATIRDGSYVNYSYEVMKFVPDGIGTTLFVTIISIIFALLMGLVAGLGRISRNPFLNRLATVYVEVVRGIPLLVWLFYIYFALGPQLHIGGLPSAILGMSFCYGAYMAEIFRAGIVSIPRGQMEAALSLGMTRGQAMRKIILPQTIKVILPPVGNEFIALLKDSSLVSIMAVSDLLRRGKEYAATTFAYMECLTAVALIYLVLTLFLSKMVAFMEGRLHNRGRR